MRILFFSAGSYVSGLEVVNLELMSELKAMGVPVFSVISGWNDGRFPRMLEERGIPFAAVKLGAIIRGNPFKIPISWTLDGIKSAPRGIQDLRRAVATFRPTHVVHVSIESAFIAMLTMGKNLRHYLHVHDPLGAQLTGPRSAYVIAKTQKIICVSDFVRQGIYKVIPNAPTAVVYNGCRSPRSQVSLIREASNITFGVVGQIAENKKIDLIAKTVHRLRCSGFICSLKIFGDDINPYALSIKAKNYTGIEWHGYVEDRSRIYNNLDCLIAARSDEPCSMAIIEAMSFGKPVVAAASGGSAELVTNTVGALFQPDSEESLYLCLQEMLEPQRCHTLGTASGLRFNTHYRIDIMARNFRDLLSG